MKRLLFLSIFQLSFFIAMDAPDDSIILQAQEVSVKLPYKQVQQSPVLNALTQGLLKRRTFTFEKISPQALDLFGRFLGAIPASKKLSREEFYPLTQKLPEFSLKPNLKMSKEIILDLIAISDILALPIMNEFLGYYLSDRIMPYYDLTQQPVIRGYYFTEQELAKLTEPIKKEIARSYYLSHGKKLHLGVRYGFSIQELANVGKIPYIKSQKKLDLSDRNIKSLDGLLHLRRIKQITTLVLSNNLLEKVPANTFTKLPLILDLRLDNNNIKTIEKDAFKHQTFLQLDLSNNSLEEISKEALGNFNAVDRLNLKDNPIKKIDPSIFNMTITSIGLPETSVAQRAKRAFEQLGIEVF